MYSLISLLIQVYLIETSCKLLMLKNLLDLDHLLLADDSVCPSSIYTYKIWSAATNFAYIWFGAL